MGNVCTKGSGGGASVSSLDTTYSRTNHPVTKPPARLASPAAGCSATFNSMHLDESKKADSESAVTNVAGYEAADEGSPTDFAMASQSWSATSTNRKPAKQENGAPLQRGSTDAEGSETETTGKLLSGTASTHHTVNQSLGHRASGPADDASRGNLKLTKPQKERPVPIEAGAVPASHPNAMQITEEDGDRQESDEELLESNSIRFSAPASPLGNPLQVRGAPIGQAAADTPSTHVGPVLKSTSSSVVERDAVTCDVHIELEVSDLSDSACFEDMLRALLSPTATERTDIVRHWADFVPRT